MLNSMAYYKRSRSGRAFLARGASKISSAIRSHCNSQIHKFPLLDGDDAYSVRSESSSDSEDEEQDVSTPTKGYIKAVADGEDTEEMSPPVLLVLSRQTGYRDVMCQDHEPRNDHQKVKLTHLVLVDGDNNQIHARLATHIADAGRKLGEGDVIRLDRFTELTYRVNETSPHMPALFILRFTRVGRRPVPVQSDLHDMLS